MKRLILVRHAKAERRAKSGEDIDRALTDEGRADAAALGHALAAAGLVPDVALVSAALRTRQTFEAMAANLPDAHLDLRRDLYDAGADALHAAAERAQADNVMIVAHNPGCHDLALSLAGEATLIGVKDRRALDEGFATATAVAFEWSDGRLGCLGVLRP